MPSELYELIIHHLTKAARRVKAVHLNITVDLNGLPDLLSFFPSLENIFCRPTLCLPTNLSLIPPSIQPQLKAVQIRVPNLKNLAIPGFLRELRWLSLAYETESMHLSSFLEALENLPHLQFLHLTRLSKPGQVTGTDGLRRTITLRELTVMISNCPIIHVIDAPKLSHLDLHVVYPRQYPVKDTYGHLCGFEFSKINHLHFDVYHGTVTGNPRRRWKDFGNVTSFSFGKYRHRHELGSKWISDEDLDLTLYYPNRFKLSFGLFWISILAVYLEKATNLVEITLEALDVSFWGQAEVDSLSRVLRLATTVRNLTILSCYSLERLCDLLSDGSLLPRLEMLSCSTAKYHEAATGYAYAFDSLRNLVNKRSEKCPVHLEIELDNFAFVPP